MLGLAADVELAFMSPDDAVNAAEAEAGCFDILGGVKGLEAARADVFRHADSIVGDGDDEPLSLDLGADDDGAAGLDGVDGVEEEVGERVRQPVGRSVRIDASRRRHVHEAIAQRLQSNLTEVDRLLEHGLQLEHGWAREIG